MSKEKFDRSKPHVNIGTIGHVDHGKTTLVEEFQSRTTDTRWLWGACDGSLTPQPLAPLLDIADQLGYTIYPVDVPGMLAAFGADVERSGPGVRGAGFGSVPSIPARCTRFI